MLKEWSTEDGRAKLWQPSSCPHPEFCSVAEVRSWDYKWRRDAPRTHRASEGGTSVWRKLVNSLAPEKNKHVAWFREKGSKNSANGHISRSTGDTGQWIQKDLVWWPEGFKSSKEQSTRAADVSVKSVRWSLLLSNVKGNYFFVLIERRTALLRSRLRSSSPVRFSSRGNLTA